MQFDNWKEWKWQIFIPEGNNVCDKRQISKFDKVIKKVNVEQYCLANISIDSEKTTKKRLISK